LGEGRERECRSEQALSGSSLSPRFARHVDDSTNGERHGGSRGETERGGAEMAPKDGLGLERVRRRVHSACVAVRSAEFACVHATRREHDGDWRWKP
jgi:hypothetical protein